MSHLGAWPLGVNGAVAGVFITGSALDLELLATPLSPLFLHPEQVDL